MGGFAEERKDIGSDPQSRMMYLPAPTGREEQSPEGWDFRSFHSSHFLPASPELATPTSSAFQQGFIYLFIFVENKTASPQDSV